MLDLKFVPNLPKQEFIVIWRAKLGNMGGGDISNRNNIGRPPVVCGMPGSMSQHNSPDADLYWEEHWSNDLDTAEFRLNRPKVLNSLTTAMCHDMLKKI